MFAYCNNNPIIFKDSQGGIPNFAIDVSDAEENPMRAGYGSQKYPNYDSSGKGKSKRTSCSYDYDTQWSGYAPKNSNSVFIGGNAPHNFDSVITEVFKNRIEINGVIIYGAFEPVNEYTVYLIYKDAVIRMDITVKSPYTYREEGSDFAVAMKQTLEGMCGYATTIGGLPGNCGELAPWLMQIL